jgi:hypothetical protein
MGYRSYDKRGPKRRNSYPRYRQREPDLAETIGGMIADGMRFLAAVIRQCIARLRHVKIDPNPPESPWPANPRIPLPYRKVPGLMTPGEFGVWYALHSAVKGKYRLFCKVRLADIVCCPPDRINERYWFRKISAFHIDFVICDPHTTAPLLAIELDDRLHRERRQKTFDDFKDAVLRVANMPIYRIPAQSAYDPEELKRHIERLIHPPSIPATINPPASL